MTIENNLPGDFTHMTTRGYTTIYLLLDEDGEHFIAGRD